MLVSQAVVFYTFSDALLHSRKPNVNLLKNMVKIIVVSWWCRRVAKRSSGCWQNHANGMVGWGEEELKVLSRDSHGYTKSLQSRAGAGFQSHCR